MDELPQQSKLEYLQRDPIQGRMVYRMLQLFCEGHNHHMQSLLCAQPYPPPYKNIDLIGTSMAHLNQLCKSETVFSTYTTEDDLRTIEALLDFLIDAMQVCQLIHMMCIALVDLLPLNGHLVYMPVKKCCSSVMHVF